MGDADEGRRNKAMENFSLQIDKHPRDLLQRFMSSSSTEQSERAEHREESEDIELNLGLSLGGRFGVDKNAKKLMRSSSIVGTMPVVRDDDSIAPPPATYPTLMRTSSLPTETEEQWRKRKELQTLRRMEAKRRRSEKHRNSKTEREGSSGGLEEERREIEGATGLNLRERRFGSAASPPFGLPGWAAAARPVVLGDVLAKGNVDYQGYGQPSSQGSMDSQGKSSSGMSEMESKPFQGEARSPASNQSMQERSNEEGAGSSGAKANENVTRSCRAETENPVSRSAKNRGREIGTNSMEDMPCVFTKGDGPNGKRIEGILYRYGKGEEVRIMCVCHGNFLSPAEFVKHAGGGDVAYPLRHIVVNPSSSPFL
ncbi:hypothetical protein L6164_020897 [Bauhinia variegata]|uniref:Uncharacterized protein n=1 Tax=Bauhinia variegata TaxID=167791 RepID=A0ACB9MWV4_BAUVA|nr:hypothetical protein L6164_020897 [Bauhinia variegata]